MPEPLQTLLPVLLAKNVEVSLSWQEWLNASGLKPPSIRKTLPELPQLGHQGNFPRLRLKVLILKASIAPSIFMDIMVSIYKEDLASWQRISLKESVS
jgi:hypothetical protein